MKCGSSFAFLIVSSLVLCLGNRASASSEDKTFDVVIYGGTSAGIAAAVQVKRMGGTVVVIEPTSRIGGLTTGGLGQTDIGNKAAIGGVSREFYQRI
ncbi:MAG TPA: FAD-dependent oxidoreductase, partial [Planctomycetes bacterium]|nr:FAD-dependent oxidoreductase [Planctomycetota bacterium]